MKNIKTITSILNPEIKQISKLNNSKNRKKTDKCIFQNIRTIETALQAKLKLNRIYLTKDNLEIILNLFKSFNLDQNLITLVSESVIKKISTLKTPSGIVAVFFIPENNLNNLDGINSGLVLADISDPGNMGTLIRTAAACDIKNIFVIEGANPYSNKVIQSSAGTIALTKIYQITWQDLILMKKKLKLYAMVTKDGENISKINTTNNVLLVVGNEANGIKSQWLKDCDKLITLPMPGNTESLNAAVAGSIALYLVFCKSL